MILEEIAQELKRFSFYVQSSFLNIQHRTSSRYDSRGGSTPLLIHLSQSQTEKCESTLFIIQGEVGETENLRGKANSVYLCALLCHYSRAAF